MLSSTAAARQRKFSLKVMEIKPGHYAVKSEIFNITCSLSHDKYDNLSFTARDFLGT